MCLETAAFWFQRVWTYQVLLFHNFKTSHKIQIFKTHAKNLPHKHSLYLMLRCLPSQVCKVFYRQTRYRLLMVALCNGSPMGPQGMSSRGQDAVPRWASCPLHPFSQSGPELGGHQGKDMEGCYFSTNGTKNRRATPRDPQRGGSTAFSSSSGQAWIQPCASFRSKAHGRTISLETKFT